LLDVYSKDLKETLLACSALATYSLKNIIRPVILVIDCFRRSEI